MTAKEILKAWLDFKPKVPLAYILGRRRAQAWKRPVRSAKEGE